MPYSPCECDTLLIPSGPNGVKHIFFVISAPLVIHGYGTSPQVLLANATSIKDDDLHDRACELSPGCHPFIKQASYVAYRFLRIDPLAHVSSMVDSGSWTKNVNCDPLVMAKIRNGLCLSKRAARDIQFALDCPNAIPR